MTLLTLLISGVLTTSPIQVEQQAIQVGSRKIGVQFVRLLLKEFEPDIAWPKAGLGTTQDMASIAKSARAAIAINGCFFDAYLDSARKNPNQNLLAGGRVIHIGGTGSTLGFDSEGRALLERVRFRYRGTVQKPNGGKLSWYAYRANHTPTSENFAGYFDRAYGERLSLTGLKVVVVSGKVLDVSYGEVPIPESGYVLLIGSGEASLQRRFAVGDTVVSELAVENGSESFWRRAVTGIGGGPKLVSWSAVDIQLDEEGFRDPKITSASASRSMVEIGRAHV